MSTGSTVSEEKVYDECVWSNLYCILQSDGARIPCNINKACREQLKQQKTAIKGNLREGFLSSPRAREEYPMTEVGRLPV